MWTNLYVVAKCSDLGGAKNYSIVQANMLIKALKYMLKVKKFLQVLFVKTEAKIVEILRCLEKTEPPVLVFAERKSDVDAIQEYLLLKGVQAVSTHGKFVL